MEKEKSKYPIGGYAPGDYLCFCTTCENHFKGDKRAVQCESCAIEMVEDQEETDRILKEAKESALNQETLEEAAYQARRNYQDEVGKDGMNECIMLDAMKIQRGFELGANWQQERSQQIVPFDATNIEVFSVKPDEDGKLFAYIGYKISNGNFHFSAVPFTDPQTERYSEEDMRDFAVFYFTHQSKSVEHWGKDLFKVWEEQFKKK